MNNYGKEAMKVIWRNGGVFPNNIRNGYKAGRKVTEPPDKEANKRLNRARKAFEAYRHLYLTKP